MRDGDLALRLLRAVRRGGAAIEAGPAGGRSVAILAGGRRQTYPRPLLEALVAQGLLGCADGAVRLTKKGRAHLRRLLCAGPDPRPVPAANRIRLQAGSGQCLEINLDESPLRRLYTRQAKGGAPFLGHDAFHAGERLRHDFEQARLQPRITQDWSGHGAGGGRSRGGAAVELSDFSLDARRRVERALHALEPSLRDVALDVCCYLKGLELVERERQWPPRSAKLMLRAALETLARHYGIAPPRDRRGGAIMHWGDEDYRPAIRREPPAAGP